MAKLNKTPFAIRLKRGTEAQITSTSPVPYQLEGEIVYATDTKQVYVSDGTSFNQIGVDIFAYDSDSGYSYCGHAPAGSATSDEVWKITRIDQSDFSSAIAEDVAWDDRLTVTYS